ncbi:radical SAM enzyme, Cfr family [Staphylococcus aureus]|nr:radical SAM enzyme, Cfr family [Staphylococcus aureus]
MVISKRVDSIDEMTNLSKDLRQLLKDNFTVTTLTTVVKQESKDGTINSYLNYKMAIQLKLF